ncbi:MAG TPA: serine hydrolase [Candidatus Scybalocola faecigallinarum]|uniref:Serine hydrolase n=1 Tax=Candidatus Scybalocola faecigallinarum TaxID=2840941 RepID=A0A9D1F4R4_9FIRM|nr:serine hydrolase [Candidatus Scybalocola faecigallinarum]
MEINLCYGCMAPREGDGPCPHCGFDENTYQPSPHHLRPGTILAGKYLLGRVLGEGGFGITYVGWDLNLEIKVAIKEYYPNGYVTRESSHGNGVTVFTGQRRQIFDEGLAKFVDEARRLGKFFALPGIVSVRDYFQENNTGYIVMEFAQGQTLKALLETQPGSRMSADVIFEMMKPVMESLIIVHKAGIIHRDISPDNLMVDDRGNVKLLDFGAARSFLAVDEKSLSVMLKPGYAPEEQYRSRGQQGPWTDVYALCATIYRAITGVVPEESLNRLTGDVLPPPSQLGVRIHPGQEQVLMKGLAVMAGDRFKDMSELKAALENPGPYMSGMADQTASKPGAPANASTGKNHSAGKNYSDGSAGNSSGKNGKQRKTYGVLIGIAAALFIAAAVVMGMVINSVTPDTSRADRETLPEISEDQPQTYAYIPFSKNTQEESEMAQTGENQGETYDSETEGETPETDTSASETEREVEPRMSEDELDRILADYGGGADFSVCALDMQDWLIYSSSNSGYPMSASSLSNICTLFTVAWMCDNGYMTLDDQIRFSYTFNGRGIKTEADDGSYFTVRELLSDMLRYSDNNAANAVMNYVTLDNINAVCQEWGFSSVDINRIYDADSALDNYASAGDLVVMLYALYGGLFESIDQTYMLENFCIVDNTGSQGIGSAIPSGYTFLNHNGMTTEKYNEAAIVLGEDASYIVVFMSDNGKMENEAETAARAGEYIHESLTY